MHSVDEHQTRLATSRPSQALLVGGDSETSIRARRFVELLGIAQQTLTVEALLDAVAGRARFKLGSSSCLILAGADALMLADTAIRQNLKPEDVIAPFSAIIFHSVAQDPAELRAIERLLGDAKLVSMRPHSESRQYRIGRQYQSECGPLSGLAFCSTGEPSVWGLGSVLCRGAVEALIEVDGAGLLTRIWRDAQRVWIASTSEIVDLDQTIQQNIDFRTCFARISPLLIALRETFRARSWLPSGAYANIVIDDPPLWPRYGRLKFESLAHTIDRLQCACTIGMIPWNFRRSTQRIVDLISKRAPRFGICVHGCNHTKAEFGARSTLTIDRLVAIARTRMLHHERLTGLQCPLVMVFPRGAFSIEAMAALKASGFLAAVNTETQDLQRLQSVTVAALLRPAILSYDAFPLFARRHPHDGALNFAMDLFLGRPCLIVLHHDFFRDGLAAFEDLVRVISNLQRDICWTDLHTIVTHSLLCKSDDENLRSVMMYTNEAHLRFEGKIPTMVAVTKHIGTRDRISRVEVEGVVIDFTVDGPLLRFSFAPANRQQVHVRIVPAQSPAPEPVLPSFPARLHIAARRYASEFRANFLQ